MPVAKAGGPALAYHTSPAEAGARAQDAPPRASTTTVPAPGTYLWAPLPGSGAGTPDSVMDASTVVGTIGPLVPAASGAPSEAPALSDAAMPDELPGPASLAPTLLPPSDLPVGEATSEAPEARVTLPLGALTHSLLAGADPPRVGLATGQPDLVAVMLTQELTGDPHGGSDAMSATEGPREHIGLIRSLLLQCPRCLHTWGRDDAPADSLCPTCGATIHFM